MRARLTLAILLGAAVAVPTLVAQDTASRQVAPQNASIRQQDLKADVYFLADDLTRGRLVGRRSTRWPRSSSSRASSASA